MPGQDKTGPLGRGSLTGRGLGLCGNGLARGFGRRFSRGFGFGIPFVQQQVITEKEEKNLLQDELKEIEAEKAEIQKRLKELK